MNRVFLLFFTFVLCLGVVTPCHYNEGGDDDDDDKYGYHRRRKRQSESEDNGPSPLTNFFTLCMTDNSNFTFDWFSATEWTISDSNWFYFTENSDCSGEVEYNETTCWMSRVDTFVDDQLSATIKLCIEMYSEDKGVTKNSTVDTIVYSTDTAVSRKRRQAPRRVGGGNRGGGRGREESNGGGGRGNGRGQGIGGGRGGVKGSGGGGEGKDGKPPPPPPSPPRPPPPPRPPRPPRNSECPRISRNYRRELQRRIPLGYRPPRPRPRPRRDVNSEKLFDINSVVDFVENFTICTECERYTEEEPVNCYTNRLDQLTRFASPFKSIIQQVNARYASGGDIVGRCLTETTSWTEWFNLDNPLYAEGDVESLERIRERYPKRVCSSPSGIQAQLGDTMQSYGQGNNTLQISPSLGLICRNSEQDNGQLCRDYRVRFCCQDYVGKCSLRSGWTPFFDSGKPKRFGEFELLTTHRNLYPRRICDTPTAIGARLLSNQTYHTGGDNVHIELTQGVACFAQLQSDMQCNDYKVRYCCPPVVGNCSRGHTWSKWFDSVEPSGDDESLMRIRQTGRLKCVGEPSAIEAQLARTKRPYFEGGEELLFITPQLGLLCLNLQQTDGKCRNYRVRFCCEKSPRKRPPPPPLPPTNGGNMQPPPPNGQNMQPSPPPKNQNSGGNSRSFGGMPSRPQSGGNRFPQRPGGSRPPRRRPG